MRRFVISAGGATVKVVITVEVPGIFPCFLRLNVITQISSKLPCSGIVCWVKEENILYHRLQSCSGQIGGSAKDLTWGCGHLSSFHWAMSFRYQPEIVEWHRSNPRSPSRRINPTTSHPIALPLLSSFSSCLSILVFVFFSQILCLHL